MYSFKWQNMAAAGAEAGVGAEVMDKSGAGAGIGAENK